MMGLKKKPKITQGNTHRRLRNPQSYFVDAGVSRQIDQRTCFFVTSRIHHLI